MKHHFITIFKVIFIIAAILGIIYGILRIDSVDKAITARLYEAPGASDSAIDIDGLDEVLPGDYIPYVFSYDDKLFVINDKVLDITPPDVAAVFYSDNDELSQRFRLRANCIVSDDKNFMLYTVDVQGISRLFLADLKQGGSVLISDNVDVFLFVGQYPVYSTGYDVANAVYYYYDGESVLMGTDVHAVPNEQTHEVAVYDKEKNVTVFRLDDGDSYKADYEDLPDVTDEKSYTSDGREIISVLWSDSNCDISVVALSDGIYSMQKVARTVSKMAGFTGNFKIYKGRSGLIEDNLRVYSGDGKIFYVSYLNSDSFILNPDNPDSWLNRFSNYEYSVASFDREGTVSYLAVPSSGLPGYFEKSGDWVVYTAYLGSGDVKSISVLSGSTVLLRDAVLSEKLSKGQKHINAAVFEDGTIYILTTDKGADYTAINRVLPDARGIETVYGCISLGTFYSEDYVFEEEYDPESGA